MLSKLIPNSYLRGHRGFLFLLMSFACTSLKPILDIKLTSVDRLGDDEYIVLNKLLLTREAMDYNLKAIYVHFNT